MATGKLYRSPDKQLAANISYRLQHLSQSGARGELTVIENRGTSDGSDYIIELAGRQSLKCYLRKLVNRALSGMPPRYVYQFVLPVRLEKVKAVITRYKI